MKQLGEQQVRQFLVANGMGKRIHRFTDSTENAYLAAQALAVELGQIVKSVVLLADKEPVLVLISGDMNVHTRKLKNVLGARKIRIADAETVLQVTGYPVGAVPPVAHHDTIPTYLDESLTRFSTIYPAAGTTNTMFSTTFDELMKLTQAKIVDVAQPKKQ
jgi:Cys-tRNA(Pro) deacylase